MYATTPKQQIAFPEVAVIRKGKPKNDKGQVGQDLQNKFRVVFYPGVDPAILTAFRQAYKSEMPERIRAFVPFPTVWDAFSSFNEAHNAGRMVALADEHKYLLLRNPLTGEYQVRNGEPPKPFTPGDTVSYDRNGKTVNLPIKTVNRLRLVIPEIVATGRLVTFTFKSTALYDKFNLEQQLGAIQALANTLNRGNAAGIPFWLYRAEREVTWNKPDGSALRTKKWLVHLEPDPEWVKTAFERMSKFALTGSSAYALPATLPEPLEMDTEPDDEEDDEENTFVPEGVFEAEARDVPPPPPATRQTTRRPAAKDLPKTLPPAPKKTGAGAAPNAPLTKFNQLGQQLWHDQWPRVSAHITKNQNPASLAPDDLKKALAYVEKRQTEIADFGILLVHAEKAWPPSVSFLPLAYGQLEQALGQPPEPLALLAAVAKAAPELDERHLVLTPEAGALLITQQYETALQPA